MKLISLVVLFLSAIFLPLHAEAQQLEVIDEQASLTVSKDDSQTTVLPQQQLIYEIVVTNNDVELELTNINLVDSLPSNVAFVSAENGGVNNNGEVSWPLFSLLPQTSFQTTVTVTVKSTAGASDLVENIVIASVEQLELFAENNDVDTVIIKNSDQNFSNPEVQPTPTAGVLGDSTEILAETGGNNSILASIIGLNVIVIALFLIRFSKKTSSEIV